MSQSTQAHLERTINKNRPLEERQQVVKQMNYYMGAKLLEVGMDPQSPEILYRWSVKHHDDEQTCTLSAFWGESKKELLSGENPLTGEELISCARANASKDIVTVAQLCGYASDVDGFRAALKEAMATMGMEVESLQKLIQN
ncbi:hypothetical protein FRE64_08485 [Euhalothece natronophila Z-M001]|uniref:Uncharacterized protein n=1 Tax=Euhalothece natronophila Z-M001 TaxID=522448 RepID=A0A5B8NKW0_9CHRO|nr:hypothetical protein [Euhalothece natronophila]QDZ39973.1 hypothetical protein FRE64_08485 [Euhalothece natronophila Z-M001]